MIVCKNNLGAQVRQTASTTHGRGRERRLRQRLFNAGNTRCPICLSDFARSDVLAGTNVTLEHAPPKSLGGAAICLTCKSCNNKASLIEQHAYQSVKARNEWAEGKGAPIVVDLFGHKSTRRFIPHDPNGPFPARKHLFRNGTIELGPLPPTHRLDASKGMSFRIPQRDDYEFVSMIKSAYLMVFALMGENGYRFAENIGLQPVREQIMNPEKKVLKGGFLGTMRFDTDEIQKLDRPVVFLCRTEKLPFWIIPMWENKVVFLTCGAEEPIDELAFNATEASIPFGCLVGWVSRRFNSSSSIAGTVGEATDGSHASLAGTVGGPFPTNRKGWNYIMVFHQMRNFVALPYCPEDRIPGPEEINVVDMLSEHEAVGRNLDKAQLTTANVGAWSRELAVERAPLVGERDPGGEPDR